MMISSSRICLKILLLWTVNVSLVEGQPTHVGPTRPTISNDSSETSTFRNKDVPGSRLSNQQISVLSFDSDNRSLLEQIVAAVNDIRLRQHLREQERQLGRLLEIQQLEELLKQQHSKNIQLETVQRVIVDELTQIQQLSINTSQQQSDHKRHQQHQLAALLHVFNETHLLMKSHLQVLMAAINVSNVQQLNDSNKVLSKLERLENILHSIEQTLVQQQRQQQTKEATNDNTRRNILNRVEQIHDVVRNVATTQAQQQLSMRSSNDMLISIINSSARVEKNERVVTADRVIAALNTTILQHCESGQQFQTLSSKLLSEVDRIQLNVSRGIVLMQQEHVYMLQNISTSLARLPANCSQFNGQSTSQLFDQLKLVIRGLETENMQRYEVLKLKVEQIGLSAERQLNNIHHRQEAIVNASKTDTCQRMANPAESNIRLIGGMRPHEGRVEILYNGQWGTVCDDDFGVTDVQVACFALGFGRVGRLISTCQGGNGPILLDDLACMGSEATLTACGHRGLGTHNCGHQEDVWLSCA